MKLQSQIRKSNKRWHICTGCGRRQRLTKNSRHWCGCNPNAPFKMMIEADYKLAHQIVRKVRP